MEICMKKVTMETIAKEIGTTKNTVSRALRGKTGVSEELRGKIAKLADAYGYKISERVPESHQPIKVTLVCNSASLSDTYFWPSVMGGIFEYSAKHHITTHTVIVDMINDDVKDLLPLQEKYCDGLLVVGTIPGSLFARMEKLNIPMVAVDHHSNHVECDYVNADNINGITKAVDFLANNGHTKIGYVNNIMAPHISSFTQRYQGYVSRMGQLGLTVEPKYILPDSDYKNPQYFHAQLDKLGSNLPTAWICTNDLTAYNFCMTLTERGLRVPEDASVIGFDNTQGLFPLQLTTLGMPQKAMGTCAMRRLVRRLRHPDEPYENIEIITRLIDKGSVATLL